MAIETAAKEYICPGERHPISLSIHLARLAAAFPPCRECPLRNDARQIAPKTSALPAGVESQLALRHDPFVAEGVRGVYLNELTRARAETLAAAFAIFLWEESPINGRNDGIDRGARQVRPTVVAGYDERPSSPSVFSSAVAGLRRMGCHVIDIGLSTKPCLRFATHHLHASGGLFVTGSGCEPSWTGMDFVGEATRPLSLPAGVGRIRELAHRPLSRPSRDAGTERTFQAASLYEQSLAARFDRLRPLTVACASPSPPVQQTVERVFGALPCKLLAVDLPVRVRNPAHRRDADVLRLSMAVRKSKADLGVLIDDDGQRCGFVDERGRYVSPGAIARFLVPLLLAENSGATILLEPGAFNELRPLVEALNGKCEACPEAFFHTAKMMSETSALYAGGDSGRHWFFDRFPTNDALVVLANVLAAASRTEAPFSELAAG
jgi:phosphomannomutase